MIAVLKAIGGLTIMGGAFGLAYLVAGVLVELWSGPEDVETERIGL